MNGISGGGDVQRYRDTCLEVKLKKNHRARTIHLNSKVMKSVAKPIECIGYEEITFTIKTAYKQTDRFR